MSNIAFAVFDPSFPYCVITTALVVAFFFFFFHSFSENYVGPWEPKFAEKEANTRKRYEIERE